jgi:hypothetical protein
MNVHACLHTRLLQKAPIPRDVCAYADTYVYEIPQVKTHVTDHLKRGTTLNHKSRPFSV